MKCAGPAEAEVSGLHCVRGEQRGGGEGFSSGSRAAPPPHIIRKHTIKGRLIDFFLSYYIKIKKKILSLQKHYKQHLIANDRFYKVRKKS